MRSLRDLDGKKLYFNVEVRPEKFVQTVTRPSRAKTRPATGLEGSTITKPVLTFVDPGSLTKRAAKVPSLAGKKGTGTIGKSKVTIEFTGEGEKGEFVVSGDIEGKGKWKLLGPYLDMETEMAKFDGKLDGNKLGGKRKMKKGGEKDEWSIELKVAPASANSNDYRNDSAPKAYEDDNASEISGTAWVHHRIYDDFPNGKRISETITVFLDGEQFVQLYDSRFLPYDEKDKLFASALFERGKWEKGSGGIIKVLNSEYSKGKFRDKPVAVQIRGRKLYAGQLKGDRFEAEPNYESSRLTPELTRDAITRAKNARWR